MADLEHALKIKSPGFATRSDGRVTERERGCHVAPLTETRGGGGVLRDFKWDIRVQL